MELTVLALNAGSSSLKFGLFLSETDHIEIRLSGSIEAIGDPDAVFSVRDACGDILCRQTEAISGQQDALARISGFLANADMPAPQAIGHRIVHGGPKLLRHCRIDDAVIADLEDAAQFAPLHVPPAIAAIRHTKTQFPGVPQIACFDTAFHADLPDVARVLPIARDLEPLGFRRYGFHGLSCESILQRIGADPPRRIVIAHLGSGASVTAIRDGMSVDTAMGLTPTGGVIMGTRSGDLDPGVLVYLLRQKKLDAGKLEQEINRHAGLQAISGLSADMRALRTASESNGDARLAVAMFCYSVRKQIAAMTAVLGGLDVLVFTGGIGENDAQTRLEICAGLEWMGLVLDEARNRAAQNPLAAEGARCSVLVLPAQEEEQIARISRSLVRGAGDRIVCGCKAE